jgi:phenylacetate-CoA ligase
LRAEATADEGLGPRLKELVVASLVRTNDEYRQLHQVLGKRAEPMISLHHFGTGGFAHGIKHRWTGEPS